MKTNLKTVRLSKKDAGLIDKFIEQNPVFENFSALARIAILDLMTSKDSIPLRPLIERISTKKPSFLWDYKLSEGQIREILNGPVEQRKWLVARILEHADFNEVWNYLTPHAIERDLPNLRLPEKTKKHWEYALKRWRNM